MVSREAIRWAFLMILGREPESEAAYDHHSGCSGVEHLRKMIIASDEGSRKLRHDLQHLFGQQLTVFPQTQFIHLHIEKTGGTSLYEALVAAFGDRPVSLPHVCDIGSYTLAELSKYAFISGHITFDEAMALPSLHKVLIVNFRDPVSRLVSLYRFHKAHPQSARDHKMVSLAQDLPPEDFFRHDAVRSDPRLDNLYVRTLVHVPNNVRVDDGLVPAALSRLNKIDAVGISENPAEVLKNILAVTTLPITDCVRFDQVTDDLPAKGGGFRSVEKINITDDLRAAIDPLIRYDRLIYAAAVENSDELKASDYGPTPHNVERVRPGQMHP